MQHDNLSMAGRSGPTTDDRHCCVLDDLLGDQLRNRLDKKHARSGILEPAGIFDERRGLGASAARSSIPTVMLRSLGA